MTKKRILVIPDTKGWAFDKIAQKIKYYLSCFYDIDILYARKLHYEIEDAKKCGDLHDRFLCVVFPFLTPDNNDNIQQVPADYRHLYNLNSLFG